MKDKHTQTVINHFPMIVLLQDPDIFEEPSSFFAINIAVRAPAERSITGKDLCPDMSFNF